MASWLGEKLPPGIPHNKVGIIVAVREEEEMFIIMILS